MSSPRVAAMLLLAVATGDVAPVRADPGPQRVVTLGMHERLVLDQDVRRVSVGDPRVLGVEVLSSRELLAHGRSVGRTNLLIWYEGGGTEDLRWTVSRDLSLLRQVLRDLHPAVRVEPAPDRDAIILRGTVPDLRYSRLAEAAAASYLRAGGHAVVLPGGPESDPAVDTADGTAAEEREGPLGDSPIDAGRRAGFSRGAGAAVINLIQVGDLPATLEERILGAVRPLGGGEVTVRRIVRGETPDDGDDTFVLEGEVPGQVQLSRILLAASAVVTGRATGGIEVLANEAGALGSGGGGGGSGDGAGFSSGRVAGGGLRGNRLASNIARAKALSAAGGRILAFVHVRDLPQVRVQVRVFEVNRTRLKDWLPELNAIRADSDQGTPPVLVPDPSGEAGGQTPDLGGTSWQMATRVLQGILLSQWQVVAGDFALDVFFALLESQGLAQSLARPTLTVLSGESANFNVGGAIPIERTVTTAAGNQNFADTFFQEFGISLAVRPLVGEDDMITLDVSPDISFPDPALTASLGSSTDGGASTTAFETRSLSTSTRLADGDVLVIGGLLQQQESVDSSYTPGIHALPGVGWFTKSLGRSREETEVVIVVSPAIVRDRVPGTALWEYPEASAMLAGWLPEVAGPGREEGAEPEAPQRHYPLDD